MAVSSTRDGMEAILNEKGRIATSRPANQEKENKGWVRGSKSQIRKHIP